MNTNMTVEFHLAYDETPVDVRVSGPHYEDRYTVTLGKHREGQVTIYGDSSQIIEMCSDILERLYEHQERASMKDEVK